MLHFHRISSLCLFVFLLFSELGQLKSPRFCPGTFPWTLLTLFSTVLKENPAALAALASQEEQQRRMRRKASQIKRLFQCPDKTCTKSYGTEGALKMHLKIKHPSLSYDPMNPTVLNDALISSAAAATPNVNLSVSSDESSITSPREDSDSSASSSPLPIIVPPSPASAPINLAATSRLAPLVAPSTLPLLAPYYASQPQLLMMPPYLSAAVPSPFMATPWPALQMAQAQLCGAPIVHPTLPGPAIASSATRPNSKRPADTLATLDTNSASKRMKLTESEECVLADTLCSLQALPKAVQSS